MVLHDVWGILLALGVGGRSPSIDDCSKEGVFVLPVLTVVAAILFIYFGFDCYYLLISR